MRNSNDLLRLEFIDAASLGHHPVPLVWDTTNKAAKVHPTGWENMQEYTLLPEHNAMAVRTCDAFTFIDCDTKNSSICSADDLRAYILTLLEERVAKEIVDKLFVEKSRGGGLHIFLQYPAPKDKYPIATSSTGAELVALYPAKKLCYTYPTPGCEELIGTRSEMSPISREELMQLIDVLKELDEPKIRTIQPAAVATQDIRLDYWRFFDKNITGEYFAQLLVEIGLEPCEKQPRIKEDEVPHEYWRRSASDSKGMSAKVYFGREPKVLLFTSSMPDFPSYQSHSRRGDWSLTASKILYYRNGMDNEKTDEEIAMLADNLQIAKEIVVTQSGNVIESTQFWEARENKNGYSAVILPDALLAVMEALGYRKHQDGFVLCVDSIIDPVDIDVDVIPALMEIVKKSEPRAYNPISMKLKSVLKNSTVLNDLPKFDKSKILRDTRTRVYRFFRNTAVVITKEGIELIPYRDLNGYIWKKVIIDRDYQPTNYKMQDSDGAYHCHVFDFVNRLSESNINIMMGILGYNMSRYNDPAFAKMTLFLEDLSADSEGDAKGGSGKSILATIIKKATGEATQVLISGKDYTEMNSDFKWSRVTDETRTILIDDVRKEFNIENYYAVITNGMNINKKGKQEFTIPFEDRPKLIVTSNYGVGDASDSTKRRLIFFDVTRYFSYGYQPINAYKKRFFDEWEENGIDWAMFDTFCSDCIVEFLRNGVQEKTVSDDLKLRILINETKSPDFVEFMEKLYASGFYSWVPKRYKTKKVQLKDGSVIDGYPDFDLWQVEFVQEKHRRNPDFAIKIKKSNLLEQLREATNNKKLTTHLVTRLVQKWAATKKGLKLSLKYEVRGEGEYYLVEDFEYTKLAGDERQGARVLSALL